METKINELRIIPKKTAIFSKLLGNSIKTTVDTIVQIIQLGTDGAVFVKPKYVKYDLPEFEPSIEDMGMDSWSVIYANTKPYSGVGKPAQHRLEKLRVCAECHSIGISHVDCVCTYTNNYNTIELEFEVCRCCGNLIEDGMPADTKFNKIAIDEYDKKREIELDEYRKKKNVGH